LENSQPSRQERSTGTLYQQDQGRSGQDFVASIWAPKHHLKFHKGDEGVTWTKKEYEELMTNLKLPWWSLLNISLNLA